MLKNSGFTLGFKHFTLDHANVKALKKTRLDPYFAILQENMSMPMILLHRHILSNSPPSNTSVDFYCILEASLVNSVDPDLTAS